MECRESANYYYLIRKQAKLSLLDKMALCRSGTSVCCGMESFEVPSSSTPHPGTRGPQLEELCCLLTSGEEDVWDTEDPALCPVCLMGLVVF